MYLKFKITLMLEVTNLIIFKKKKKKRIQIVHKLLYKKLLHQVVQNVVAQKQKTRTVNVTV